MKLDRTSFLFLSFFVLASFLLVTAVLKIVPEKKNFSSPPADFNLDYRRRAGEILDFYLNRRSKLDFSAETAVKKQWQDLFADVRNRLLELTLGARFQDNHLGLVLKLNQLEKIIDSGGEEEFRSAESDLIRLFSQIR